MTERSVRVATLTLPEITALLNLQEQPRRVDFATKQPERMLLHLFGRLSAYHGRQ